MLRCMPHIYNIHLPRVSTRASSMPSCMSSTSTTSTPSCFHCSHFNLTFQGSPPGRCLCRVACPPHLQHALPVVSIVAISVSPSKGLHQGVVNAELHALHIYTMHEKLVTAARQLFQSGLCVCVCVCLYLCVHACAKVCVYMYMHMNVYVYVCVWVCKHLHLIQH